ncbi:MAG: hypothetical protein JO334_10180 [Verrucomicrobia bacterium]|nr:hypothetical protein [Verrucomicrobiota bacterium]
MTAYVPIAPFLTLYTDGSATAATFGTITERDAGDAANDAIILQKLGRIGWERLYDFRTYYTQGWGEGDGQPVSPRALASLYVFLDNLELQPGMVPSIYLLKDGSLGLAWEDTAGDEVELSFYPQRIHFYRGSDNTELEVPTRHATELSKFAKHLSSSL